MIEWDLHRFYGCPDSLPAHITVDQAKGVMESLLKGDAAQVAVVRNSARAVGAQLFAKAEDALGANERRT